MSIFSKALGCASRLTLLLMQHFHPSSLSLHHLEHRGHSLNPGQESGAAGLGEVPRSGRSSELSHMLGLQASAAFKLQPLLLGRTVNSPHFQIRRWF